MRNLSILLVKVPTFSYPQKDAEMKFSEKNRVEFTPSYALATLSAFIEAHFSGEHNLEVYDMNLEAINFDGSVDALGVEALRKAESKIMGADFDVFAVSGQFMFNQEYAVDVVGWAKRRNPGAKVIVGGGYPTIFPDKSIAQPDVDYVAIGEAEHTFVHILNRIAGVEDVDFDLAWFFDGYAAKSADGAVSTVPKTGFLTNLEKLPVPAWEYPGIAEYLRDDPNAYLPFMASRGCPMACNFCSTHLTWGTAVRYRPAAKVVDEIVHWHEALGVKRFHCIDDNVTFDKKWILEFVDEVVARDVVPKVEFSFSNFDMRHLNREILRGIRKLGVSEVTVATESGNPDVRRKINKKLHMSRITETIDMLHDEGFFIHNNFIIGFPGETLEQIHDTVGLARQLRTDSIQIYPCFPFPGTKVYDDGKAMGVVTLDEDDYSALSRRRADKIHSDEWDGEMVKNIAYDANIEMNFLVTPLYDTEAGRGKLGAQMDTLKRTLPGHAVAYIVLGYLAARFEGDAAGRDENYALAVDSLLGEDRTFDRFMHWNFPQIRDFRQWVGEHRPDDVETIFSGAAKSTEAGRKQVSAGVDGATQNPGLATGPASGYPDHIARG